MIPVRFLPDKAVPAGLRAALGSAEVQAGIAAAAERIVYSDRGGARPL